MVFLHGITANRRHWDPVVELLPDRYRRLNVDLLGHGESPRGESANLLSQVGALVALLEHLEVEAPVLVGHSYGAFIVTFVATTMPVRAVVNIDQPFDTVAFQSTLRSFEHQLGGDDFGSAITEYVETQGPDLVPAERQKLCRGNIRPNKDVVLEVWSQVLESTPDELLALVEASLPAVAAPYLAIFGSPISAEERRLQKLIPDSQVEVWDGLGHFVQLVDPERTAQRIVSFVEKRGT